MKLNKGYIKHIQENYSALFPDFKKKKTRNITTLALTLIGISFFAIFAINPTLSTIAQLNKQLSDSQFVEDELTKKIENLSVLRQQYNLLQNQLPVVFSAIPKTPSVVTLTGQIQAIAQTSNVEISQMQISKTDLFSSVVSGGKSPSSPTSFTFGVSIKGNYEDILNFINLLVSFNRIITINSISISKDHAVTNLLQSNIQAKAYYKR